MPSVSARCVDVPDAECVPGVSDVVAFRGLLVCAVIVCACGLVLHLCRVVLGLESRKWTDHLGRTLISNGLTGAVETTQRGQTASRYCLPRAAMWPLSPVRGIADRRGRCLVPSFVSCPTHHRHHWSTLGATERPVWLAQSFCERSAIPARRRRVDGWRFDA